MGPALAGQAADVERVCFNREQEREAEKLAGKLKWIRANTIPCWAIPIGEIAGMSRSHAPQPGHGRAGAQGLAEEFPGDHSGRTGQQGYSSMVSTRVWDSVPGSAPVSRLLAEAARTFEPEHPPRPRPILLKAEPMMAALASSDCRA